MDRAEFLHKIWGSLWGYGEIREIDPVSHEVTQTFLQEGDIDRWAHTWVPRGKDTYFGVLPRATMGGKAENCETNTAVLWADFDMKHFGGSRADTLRAMDSVSPAPQIVVASGHGFHCYWLLDEPVGWHAAEAIMKGIEREHGSDHCSDQARVLRVPDTLNYKDHPPALVRIVVLDELAPRYPVDAFDPYVRMDRPYHPLMPVAHNGTIPNSLSEDLDFDPGKGMRSEHIMSCVCRLIRVGLTDEEVAFKMEQSAAGSAKAEEKGRSWQRYIDGEIRRAHQLLEEDR